MSLHSYDPHFKIRKDERNQRISELEAALETMRADLLDTCHAIGVVGLGLVDPLASDSPNEPPAEWRGLLSDKVAALRAERDRYRAALERIEANEANYRLAGIAREALGGAK